MITTVNCRYCDHPRESHAFFPDGRTAPLCEWRNMCECEGYANDHSQCPSGAHDRSLPDPLDGQAAADDGMLACNDCGRPAFYCSTDERYHHVDPAATCFLIRD